MSEPFSVNYSSGALSGKVKWASPSNIALIKYWGKRDRQLPCNPSISLTLSKAITETTIEYEFIEAMASPGVHFTFNGISDGPFAKRIEAYIKNLVLDIPALSHVRMNIHSVNNFPHSAGIASSASAFSALALGLCSVEKQLDGDISGSMDFFKKASYLARLGSGSACRSVYGKYVIWGAADEVFGSSNLYGYQLPFDVNPLLMELHDSILIVSSEKKQVSSSAGHDLMKLHPYAIGRYKQARENVDPLIKSMQTGDMDEFARIVETEALSLHGLMMSSPTGFMLLKPGTVSIIQRVIDYRKRSKIPVCFTLDAGPNVHLLYPGVYKEQVLDFIKDELLIFCEDKKVIHDFIGSGPMQIE